MDTNLVGNTQNCLAIHARGHVAFYSYDHQTGSLPTLLHIACNIRAEFGTQIRTHSTSIQNSCRHVFSPTILLTHCLPAELASSAVCNRVSNASSRPRSLRS